MKSLLITCLLSLLILPFTFLQAQNLSEDALYNAIMKDSTSDIIFATDAGVDLENCKNGNSALVWAVLLKKRNAIEALLKCGAKPNARYLNKPLIEHCKDLKNYDAMCLLVKYGADNSGYLHDVNKYLRTNLISAISSNSEEKIRYFVKLGAGIELNSAIHAALHSKKYKALLTLIELGANVDKPYGELLRIPLENGDIDSAILLLRHGAQFDGICGEKGSFDCNSLSSVLLRMQYHYQNSRLKGAIPEDKGFAFINLLINKGYELNGKEKETNALFLVLSRLTYKNIDMNKLLNMFNLFTQRGANVNQEVFIEAGKYSTILLEVLSSDHCWDNKDTLCELVSLLIRTGADINKKGFPTNLYSKPITPLFHAIKRECSQKVIDCLLENGAVL